MKKLSKSQVERLDLLIEESGEIIQACCKIKRFGFESRYPTADSTDNRENLEMEIGGLCAVLDLMSEAGDIDEAACAVAQENKLAQFPLYTKYQETKEID